MHKFIYSITLTDGFVEHAGFTAIESADLPLVPGTIAGDYTSPSSVHIDQYGRVTSIVSGSAGSGSGTVTTVSVVTANGVSGSVANPTTTPAITLTLGDITPTSVVSSGAVSGSNLSGTNTGDQTITLTSDVTGSGTGSFATTIANAAVTSAKMANMAALSVKGRSANSIGVPGDIAFTGGTPGQFLTARTVLGVTSLLAATIRSVDLPSLDDIANNAAAAADVTINSHKLTNVLDPTAAQDAATKNYVDTAVAALEEHAAVKYATAAALTELSYTNNGGVGDVLTLAAGVVLIDGQAMTVGDRVLIKNQAAPAHNGIWTVTTVGIIGVSAVFTRATDFDQEADGIAGAVVFVTLGTVNDDTRWQCSATGVITWGTTALNWSQFTGSTYTADETTLHLTGTTFSIISTYVGQTSITTLGTVTTGTWSATRVALAKIAAATANSVLLGSGDAGSGATYSEISLGTNLSMTGTTLSAVASTGVTALAAHNSVLLGSGTAGAGGPYSEITLGANLTMAGATLSASATDPISSVYPAFAVTGLDDEFNDGNFTGWTLVNDGTHLATVTESNNVCSVLLPGTDTAAHLQAYMKAATVSVNDYIETAFRCIGENQNFAIGGLIFADGLTYGSGNQVTWYLSQAENSVRRNGFTGYNAQLGSTAYQISGQSFGSDIFMRFAYEGSNNWRGYISCDGVSWVDVTGQFAVTLTPTAVGFFVTTWGGTKIQMFSFRYFHSTSRVYGPDAIWRMRDSRRRTRQNPYGR